MNQNIPFQFHNTIIARLPALPFVRALTNKHIDLLLHNEAFLEAIYLSSPVLYNECIKLREGKIEEAKAIQKIQVSITKYYERMYSRCTPFGLFSGCGTLQWSDNTNIHLNTAKERHTRFDMHYLCALAQELSKKENIKNQLLYFPNSSCYELANEIRYIEYQYKDGRRKHQISAVGGATYLHELLEAAKQGLTIAQLHQLLTTHNIDDADAVDFINEMIEAQLLVNELEPAITGEEFIYQILKVLKKMPHDDEAIQAIIQQLESVDKAILTMDKQRVNSVTTYLDIQTQLKTLEVPFEENKLFQTDLFFNLDKSTLAHHYQKEILKSFELLAKLFSHKGNYNQDNFIKKFNERYEDQELPLLQVLDAETGIGYTTTAAKSVTPLIDDIPVHYQTNGYKEIRMSGVDELLLKKLIAATAQQVYEIVLDEKEFKAYTPKYEELPPSLSCMFRVVDEDRIIVEHFSGASTANLLGRFAHGSKKIETVVNEITEQEQALNEAIIFAEIIHLPESRIGNILLHPPFRKYEIPFLAKSSLPQEQQITLDDLYVSVQQNKIILRSKRLNKIIVPRLSTAHNYSYNALPVYQFLCDLQSQSLTSSLSFSWGAVASYFNFLPRVSYGNTILSEATWNFDKELVTEIVGLTKESFIAFQKKYQLPQYFVLADLDNELLIDATSDPAIKAFQSTIKNRTSIQLKEFIVAAKPIFQHQDQFYYNQLIAPLIKTTKTYDALLIHEKTNNEAQRNFITGTEWVYYKLYCGVNDADLILSTIHQLANDLLMQQTINQWFFIRYNDPEFHLRLRFHVDDASKINKVILTCKATFEMLTTQKLIWKLQLDSYQRELGRYHPQLIEASEQLFFFDSLCTTTYINQHNTTEEARWLFAMQKILILVDAFEFTLEEKINLFDRLKEGFSKEHKLKRVSLLAINKKYTDNIKLINDINSFHIAPYESVLMKYTTELNQLYASIKDTILTNQIQKNSIVESYIHMSLNRVFITGPRLHETVVYIFMYKYYNGLKFKNKMNVDS
jgi:lantibiotic biosynthesis protein